MKKRWQVLLSVVLVMVFSVSFSVPVFASDVDLGAEDVVYITEEELQEYKVSEDDFSEDDFSGSARNSGFISGNLSPRFIEITSSSASLQGLTGLYNPTTNSIVLDNIGRPGQDNALYCSGYFVYRFSSVKVDLRSDIASGTCNAVTYTLKKYPSYNIEYYSYQASNTRYFCASAGDPVWGIGPSYISSVDDIVPIDYSVGSVTLPISSLGFNGVYYLYFLQPFYSYTYVLPSGLRNSNALKFSNLSYEIVGSYQATTGELAPSDIINQTNEINNNFTQQTQQQTDTLTTGYDNSGMNSSNDKLSSSLTEYDNTESQVMDQSVQYIDAVTFFDPTTHLQLMSCITYTSTFLQDLFVALGDWSVLVLIALSLAFALMLIGWFKYRS